MNNTARRLERLEQVINPDEMTIGTVPPHVIRDYYFLSQHLKHGEPIPADLRVRIEKTTPDFDQLCEDIKAMDVWLEANY